MDRGQPLILLALALLPFPRLRAPLALVAVSHLALFSGFRAPVALALIAVYVALLRTLEPRSATGGGDLPSRSPRPFSGA